jgi:hypothetical protein
MVAGPTAVDRANPRYPQAQPARGNLAAADLELSTNDLNELDTASAGIEVQGARYPEAMQRMIDK